MKSRLILALILAGGMAFGAQAADTPKGQTIELKDGTKYLMKDDALWKQLSIKGTLHPSH